MTLQKVPEDDETEGWHKEPGRIAFPVTAIIHEHFRENLIPLTLKERSQHNNKYC